MIRSNTAHVTGFLLNAAAGVALLSIALPYLAAAWFTFAAVDLLCFEWQQNPERYGDTEALTAAVIFGQFLLVSALVALSFL